MLTAFLLYDGKNENDVTFEMMQKEGVFARLVELIQAHTVQEDTQLHQMLLELMYESSRIQRLSWEDLSAFSLQYLGLRTRQMLTVNSICERSLCPLPSRHHRRRFRRSQRSIPLYRNSRFGTSLPKPISINPSNTPSWSSTNNTSSSPQPNNPTTAPPSPTASSKPSRPTAPPTKPSAATSSSSSTANPRPRSSSSSSRPST